MKISSSPERLRHRADREPRHTALKYVGGAALAGAGIVGTVIGIQKLYDMNHPDSLIVAGVPGQVEGHYTGSHAALVGKIFITVHDYYLGIEQCPADIQAVENGTYNGTPSYDPKVGERSPQCNWDEVPVSPETWSAAPDGSEITFAGTVGAPLRK